MHMMMKPKLATFKLHAKSASEMCHRASESSKSESRLKYGEGSLSQLAFLQCCNAVSALHNRDTASYYIVMLKVAKGGTAAVTATPLARVWTCSPHSSLVREAHTQSTTG